MVAEKKISWNSQGTRLCDFYRDLHDLDTFTHRKMGHIIVSPSSFKKFDKMEPLSHLIKKATILSNGKNLKKVKKAVSRWRKFFDSVQTTRLTKRQTFWSSIEERIEQSGWLFPLLPLRSILLQWLDAGCLSDRVVTGTNASTFLHTRRSFKVFRPDLNSILHYKKIIFSNELVVKFFVDQKHWPIDPQRSARDHQRHILGLLSVSR